MSAQLAIDEILFDVAPGETRAALMSDGVLVELAIERDASPSLVGNIYLGRATKLAPAMDAAFVDLGGPGAGFLARGDVVGALDPAGKPLRPPSGAGNDAAIGRLVSEGEALLVQVEKDAVGGKSPRLSARVTLPFHRLVYSPCRPGLSLSRRIVSGAERARLEAALAPHLRAGEGAVLRTAAEGASTEALLAELEHARVEWQQLVERARAATAPALIVSDPGLVERTLRDFAGPSLRRVVANERMARDRAHEFIARFARDRAAAAEVELHRGREPVFARHEIEDAIEQALEPRVPLPSGGNLVFGALEALTAIDVDTARQAGAGRLADTALAVNLEAAREIARQIRLRNIAGLIVIDFVHMEDATARARVADALRAAFARDPVPMQLGGFTALGLFEMTRKRVREPLADLLLAPCDACAGAARLKSDATVAYEILRAAARAADAAAGKGVAVVLAPSVANYLAREGGPARKTAEAGLGRTLELKIETGRARDRYDIVTG
jgi:ribonuclease G